MIRKFVVSALAFAGVMLVATLAMAQEHGAGSSTIIWSLPLGIGLGIGIAAMGGGFGEGRTVAAALEGIARNPQASDKVFVPMVLGLAFIESLVLFTWVLMLLMYLKM